MGTKVIYHANCTDGFCAAWILSKVYPDAEFISCQYGQQAEDFDITTCEGDEVIIADFSFNRQKMIDLNDIAKSLICYDHHKTAEADLKGLDFCKFDMSQSGAALVWRDYFKDIRGLAIKKYEGGRIDKMVGIINYTEDRDLWRWRLRDSKEFSASLKSYPMTFESWDNLPSILEMVTEGKAILRYQEQLIESMVRHATRESIAGYTVPCVNTTTLTSEVVGRLADENKRNTFAAGFFHTKDGEKVFSLRSREGGVDVSEIAKKYGGGGHKHAAGFVLKPNAERVCLSDTITNNR